MAKQKTKQVKQNLIKQSPVDEKIQKKLDVLKLRGVSKWRPQDLIEDVPMDTPQKTKK